MDKYTGKLPFIAILSLSIFIQLATQGANYYWVGGTGNWSDCSHHWVTSSGGNTFQTQVPQSVDNVYFDANSFNAPNDTVYIDQTVINCSDMNWTGVNNNPTFSSTSGFTVKIYGSLTFVPGMTVSITGPVSFESTTTGKTITSAGQAFGNGVTFNGIGGGWTLLDSFTIIGTNDLSVINLNNGTLNTNNQIVTAFAFYSVIANTRALNMGSSVFNLSCPNGFKAWEVTAQGFTLNAGTSTINCTGNIANSTPEFAGDGLTYYDLNFTGTITSSVALIQESNTFHNVFFASQGTITGNNIFHNVVFAGDGFIQSSNIYDSLTFTAGQTYTLNSGDTQTINNGLSANGTCTAFITINASTAGSLSTIKQATGSLTVDYVYLQDINATGGAVFTANNVIDLGDNTGWTLNTVTAHNLYWVGNSGNWSDGSHWSLSSGGAAYGCTPTPMDNVFFDANSFSSTGETATIDVAIATCNSMSWVGVANNPTLAGVSANTLQIYGSLTFVPGMVLTFAGDVSFEAATAGKTLTSAGKIFNNNVAFNGTGGGWKLLDSISVTYIIYLNNGTLTTNSQNVSASEFLSNTSTIRTLNMDTSVFNLFNYTVFWQVNTAGMTINCGLSTINATCNQPGWNVQFYGGGFTYYNLSWTSPALYPGTGEIDDNNNTFHDVTFAADGRIDEGNIFHVANFEENGFIGGNNTFDSLIFAPGYVYTINSGTRQNINQSLLASGNCAAFITISSYTSGTQATLSQSTGPVTVNYVIMEDIKATGGATFIANNVLDLGGNTGWTLNVLASHNLYWIGNSGNWSDGSHWSLTSGGVAYNCIPTPLDNVFFDANSFTTTGKTVAIDIPVASCNNMSWTGAAYNPTLGGGSGNSLNLKIYGSLTFIRAMTFNFGGPVSFEATTAGQTITSGGQTYNYVNFNGVGGGWTLLDSLKNSRDINLNNGTLTTNNQNVTTYRFFSTSGTPRTLNMDSSVFDISSESVFWQVTPANGLTLNAGASTINATCNAVGWDVDFFGGGYTYYNLNWTGTELDPGGYGDINDNDAFHDVTFASSSIVYGHNTFHNVTFSKNASIRGSNSYNDLTFSPSYTYTLAAGDTQTVDGNLNTTGTGSFPIRIQSGAAGTQATFFKPNGVVCADYIRLSDNEATGGATFYAGGHSQDISDNSGWNFTGGGAAATVSISAEPSGTVCPGASVQFNAIPVNGGTSPIYQWLQNGNPVALDSSTYTNNNFANGDVISCILTSNATCVTSPVDTANFTINVYNEVAVSTFGVNAVCNGTGRDSANVTAGTAPFKFSWSNGDTTQVISNLPADTYTLTVTDAHGCTAIDSTVINVTAGGISLLISSSSTSCGSSNGSVRVNVTAGTGPFTFLWNNGDTAQNISRLAAGTYSLTVTGAGGCTSADSAKVDSSAVAVSPIITCNYATICSGDSTQICADTGYVSYLWNTGGTSPCTEANAAENYYVIVTDHNNCSATSAHLPVSVYPAQPVSIDRSGDTLSSSDESNYQWLLNGSAIPNATGQVYIATQQGTYTVEVTDTNGCHIISGSITITGISEPLPDVIEIYPNPVSTNAIQLIVSREWLYSNVEIDDNNGRLVFQSKINQQKLEIPFDLARGVYFIRISSPASTGIKKVIRL